MKKFFFAVALLLSLTSFSQTVAKIDPCPPGHHLVLVNSCDGFRFHRPVLNCERGFWFCSYGCTGWHWECWPNPPFGSQYKASLDSSTNVAKVWAQLIDNNKIEFHIPSAIAALDGYTKEDMAQLNVDDELVLELEDRNCKLVSGSYSVRLIDGDFVIVVDYIVL